MVQIFVEAGILCGLLYLFAKYEADYSFAKVAMVTAGTTVGLLLIDGLLPVQAFWIKLPLSFAFIAFMLMTFCWISLGKSILVVTFFFMAHVGLSIVVALITARVAGSVEDVMSAPVNRSEQAFNEVVEGMYGPGAFQDGGPEAEALPESDSLRDSKVEVIKPKEKVITESVKKESAGDGFGGWTSARKQITISGRMKGANGGYLIIDGAMYEQGDVVQSEYEHRVYRWKVKEVQGRKLDLVPVKQ